MPTGNQAVQTVASGTDGGDLASLGQRDIMGRNERVEASGGLGGRCDGSSGVGLRGSHLLYLTCPTVSGLDNHYSACFS